MYERTSSNKKVEVDEMFPSRSDYWRWTERRFAVVERYWRAEIVEKIFLVLRKITFFVSFIFL